MLSGNLANGGVPFLLPNSESKYDTQGLDDIGLKPAYVRLQKYGAFQTVEQGGKDDAVQNA